MANKEWRGINDLYFVRGKEESEPEPEDIEEDEEPPEIKKEPGLTISQEMYAMGYVKCKEHDAIIEYLKKQGAKSGKELVEE